MERKLYPKKRFTYKFHNCNIWWWGKAFGCHLKPVGQRFWAHGRRLMLKSIPLVGAFRPRRLEWSPLPSKDCLDVLWLFLLPRRVITIPSRSHHYHFSFFGPLWWPWWLSMSSLQVFWVQRWHFKFFGALCGGCDGSYYRRFKFLRLSDGASKSFWYH